MADPHPHTTPHLDLDPPVLAWCWARWRRGGHFRVRNQLHRLEPRACVHHHLASPREQQTSADLVPLGNPLRYRARCKRLLDNPKLVHRRPPPPPFPAHPNLNLLGKTALKRPLTSLIRRLVHLRCWPSPLRNPVSSSHPRRERCRSAHAYINQAGRCLAFEVPTAALFHMFRAADSVLRRWYKQVTGVEPKVKMRNWGTYIRKLRECGVDEKILSALEQIKELHRNPVIHPEAQISIEEVLSF